MTSNRIFIILALIALAAVAPGLACLAGGSYLLYRSLPGYASAKMNKRTRRGATLPMLPVVGGTALVLLGLASVL